MKIAVINSGSSSLKFKLFDMDTKELIYSKLVENIGEKNSKVKTHHEALESLDIDFSSLDAIGHRVVHGGDEFHMPTIVNDEVLKKIKNLIPLAPLHNPANIEGIEVACGYALNIPQIAVFDTAFHFHMPREAYLYALPFEMYEKHKIRRYGFHGTSHSFVSKESAKILKKDLSELNLITLHLGNGASACAIQKGISIDTSMGFTPLEGLVMGTRSGDIDPAILIYLQKELGLSVDEVDKILNKKSGLLGICGKNDVRELINSKDEKSKLALDMMIRRVKKYIGSYMALLGDVDAIVFTGGIGENSDYIRDKILDSAFFNGIKILVIKTDEELEIANECLRVLRV
ncbi:MAG: acetate kinase [Sulfurimonas sp.]|nr:acetate kinase [Sulfurimonas sp.]